MDAMEVGLIGFLTEPVLDVILQKGGEAVGYHIPEASDTRFLGPPGRSIPWGPSLSGEASWGECHCLAWHLTIDTAQNVVGGHGVEATARFRCGGAQEIEMM